jgi:hypothetical protein
VPPNKTKLTHRQKQALRRRIAKNNEIVKKKAQVLVDAGLLPKNTARTLVSPKGYAGLTAQQKTQRKKVQQLFGTRTKPGLGGYLVDHTFKKLPPEQSIKARKVTETQSKKAKEKGYTVIRSPTGTHVVTKTNEKITKSGDIIDKRSGLKGIRHIPIEPDDLIENDETGETPLYRKIKKKFADQAKSKNPKRVGFVFGVNEGHGNVVEFGDPDEMYEYLLQYGEDLEKVGGIVLLTYAQMNKYDKANYTRRMKAQASGKRYKRPYKKISELTPRQAENRRVRDRIKYARQRAARIKRNRENEKDTGK